MLLRTVAGVTIVLGLFALSAVTAMADTLTSATLTGDCRYVTITATAINLTPGTTYKVDYSVVQSGAPSHPQPAGTITFTATATSQTVNQTGNWNPPLTTDVTLHDGTATLKSSGSTVQISPLSLNCGAPPLTQWGIVARAIHVLAIVVWIGGVWLVTTVMLPAIMQKPLEERMREFHAIEYRFAPQARMAMLLVLLTGLYMLYQYNFWKRFADRHYWWMHFMVGVWLLFAAVELLIIRRTLRKLAMAAPQRTLIRMLLVHRVILAFSLLAIFAAIGGSHGLF
jgi:uncharacterized membrane protein